MSLLTQASLVLTPNATKASKLYSIVPSNGNGDMTVVRATTATRVNSLGLIENVASNVARLNYEGDCPSILLEPQRTNLVTYSDNVPTAVANISTYVLDSSVSTPANTNNAYKFTPSVLNASLLNASAPPENRLWFQVSSSNTTFTNSVYVKSVSGSSFNLAIKVVNYATDTEKASTTINVNNNWQRVSVTGITDGTSIGERLIIKSEQAVYLWGFQIEQGAYPTSYIPTVASTVTRNLDVISKTGISDLIGQTEGVLFVESAALANDLIQKRISISDGTSANRIYLYYSSTSNVVSLFGQSNGINFSTVISYDLTDRTQFAKIAVRYKVNDISLWVNGINRGTLTSQALPLNLSRFGFDAQGLDFHSKTKQVQLYKTYLTDTEMANLTTL